MYVSENPERKKLRTIVNFKESRGTGLMKMLGGDITVNFFFILSGL